MPCYHRNFKEQKVDDERNQRENYHPKFNDIEGKKDRHHSGNQESKREEHLTNIVKATDENSKPKFKNRDKLPGRENTATPKEEFE